MAGEVTQTDRTEKVSMQEQLTEAQQTLELFEGYLAVINDTYPEYEMMVYRVRVRAAIVATLTRLCELEALHKENEQRGPYPRTPNESTSFYDQPGWEDLRKSGGIVDAP